MSNNISIIPKALIHLKKDNILKNIINQLEPITLHKISSEHGFNYLSNVIISQQLSIYAAKSITTKFQNHFGLKYNPRQILDTSDIIMKSLGISSQKNKYLKNLSLSVENKIINFYDLEKLNNDDVITKLTCVKGIGVWTAKMYLISVLGRPDVFPNEDGAFTEQIKKLYSNKFNGEFNKMFSELNSKWSPYQSIAAIYIWKSKDEKLSVL